MYVELTASQPAEQPPYPQPVDVPELSEGPHLGYAVQWFIFSIAVGVGWVLAVRKSISARRAGATGFTTSRRRIAHGSRRSTAVIVRLTSPGVASTRRYGAHVVLGQVEEGVEERRQLVAVEPQQHLQAVVVQPAGPAHRRRPHGVPDPARHRPAVTASAMAAATRGAARSDAATEKPVAGWVSPAAAPNATTACAAIGGPAAHRHDDALDPPRAVDDGRAVGADAGLEARPQQRRRGTGGRAASTVSSTSHPPSTGTT